MALASYFEEMISKLRDVHSATVRTTGGAPAQIHVTTTSIRSANAIVRDVQALLYVKLGLAIDARIVSIAHINPPSMN